MKEKNWRKKSLKVSVVWIEPARFGIANLETNHYTEDKNLFNNYRLSFSIFYYLTAVGQIVTS